MSNILVQCPHCPSQVKQTNLDKHISRVHSPSRNYSLNRPQTGSNTLIHHHSPKYSSDGFCTCEGSNENCRYCFGTGRISKTQLKPKEALSTHGTATINFGYIPLYEPAEPFVPDVPKISQKTKLKKQNFKSIKRVLKVSLIQCPECPVHVKKERLSKHLKKVHSLSAGNKMSKPFNRILGLEEVQKQLANTRTTKLRKKRRNERDLVAEHRERIHPHIESRYESPQMIRNQDYTKPYAHAYREDGRYGSHPSHDGFDDESNP
jgi:hypothetical protein